MHRQKHKQTPKSYEPDELYTFLATPTSLSNKLLLLFFCWSSSTLDRASSTQIQFFTQKKNKNNSLQPVQLIFLFLLFFAIKIFRQFAKLISNTIENCEYDVFVLQLIMYIIYTPIIYIDIDTSL